MAVAKRDGPDFFFLANAHSQKFADIEKNPWFWAIWLIMVGGQALIGALHSRGSSKQY